jgi:hypothetical protein
MVTTEYRWRGHERDSVEVLQLDDGRARSTVSFDSSVWRYEITLDEWRTTSATVGTLSIEHGEQGWIVDGALRPDLSEAIDVDIVLTPFTNTLPIRRRRLEIGEHADFVMAWIDVPSLDVTADPQRYTRLDRFHYRFDSLDSDFTRDLEVDADGIVVHYPGLFDRI